MLEGTLQIPANQLCVRALMTLLQFESTYVFSGKEGGFVSALLPKCWPSKLKSVCCALPTNFY
jgi:hypothetical protein